MISGQYRGLNWFTFENGEQHEYCMVYKFFYWQNFIFWSLLKPFFKISRSATNNAIVYMSNNLLVAGLLNASHQEF